MNIIPVIHQQVQCTHKYVTYAKQQVSQQNKKKNKPSLSEICSIVALSYLLEHPSMLWNCEMAFHFLYAMW